VSADPSPLRPCPTPRKRGYRSPGEALAGVPVNASTRCHRPYLCRCGRWHITSMPLDNPEAIWCREHGQSLGEQ